jgi:hypothetical protein
LNEKALVRLVMRNWINIWSIKSLIKSVADPNNQVDKFSFGEDNTKDLAFLAIIRKNMPVETQKMLGLHSISNKNLLTELNVLNTQIISGTPRIVIEKEKTCPPCPKTNQTSNSSQNSCPKCPDCTINNSSLGSLASCPKCPEIIPNNQQKECPPQKECKETIKVVNTCNQPGNQSTQINLNTCRPYCEAFATQMLNQYCSNPSVIQFPSTTIFETPPQPSNTSVIQNMLNSSSRSQLINPNVQNNPGRNLVTIIPRNRDGQIQMIDQITRYFNPQSSLFTPATPPAQSVASVLNGGSNRFATSLQNSNNGANVSNLITSSNVVSGNSNGAGGSSPLLAASSNNVSGGNRSISGQGQATLSNQIFPSNGNGISQFGNSASDNGLRQRSFTLQNNNPQIVSTNPNQASFSSQTVNPQVISISPDQGSFSSQRVTPQVISITPDSQINSISQLQNRIINQPRAGLDSQRYTFTKSNNRSMSIGF